MRLNEQECAALIKVLGLKNKLTDMEMQFVYFCGSYDSVEYLEKAGILTSMGENLLTENDTVSHLQVMERVQCDQRTASS